MSWLFSRALVEASSVDICLDGAPCALSSGTPTPQASWLPAKTTGVCRLSRSGMTFRPLTEGFGEAVLMSYLAAFPVRTSAPPEKAPASKGSEAECGSTWRESSVRYCRNSSSWKTHQCLWEEDLPSSSLTLLKWGMMQSGVLWERTTPEHLTSEIGSGLWPTPQAHKTTRSGEIVNSAGTAWDGKTKPHSATTGRPITTALADAVAMWSTPTAQDAKNNGAPSQMERNTKPLNAQVGGSLNPTWVEWLMEWPLGWTDCAVSATDKFRQWQRSHGIS